MISEPSSVNKRRSIIDLQQNMITHRIWVVALAGLLFFIFYVAIPLIAFVNTMANNTDENMQVMLARDTASTFYGISALWLSIVVGVMAVIFSIQGFAWLYKTRSVDFYESAPFSRLQRYLMIAANNLLIFSALLIVATFVGVNLSFLFGGLTFGVFGDIVFEMFRLWVLFFAVSGIGTLAAVVSGTTVIAVLLMLYATLFEPGVNFILGLCRETYFTTVIIGLPTGGLHGITTPIFFDISHMMEVQAKAMQSKDKADVLLSYLFGLRWEALILLVGLAAYAIGYAAYRARKSEHAGKGICFSYAESVVKMSIAIMGGLYAAFAIDVISDTAHHIFPVLSIAFLIFISSIICLICEIIFAKNVKGALKRLWQLPICLGASLFILYAYKLDFFGYDRYVPAMSMIESAGFCYGEISSDGSIDEGCGSELFTMHLEDEQIQALRKIAKQGMRFRRENIKGGNLIYNPDYVQTGWDATVLYRLKDGREVKRLLLIPFDVDPKLMNVVVGSTDYKRSAYCLDGMHQTLERAKTGRSQIQINYEYGLYSHTAALSVEDAEEFLQAYARDLEKYNFQYARDERAIGMVDLNVESQSQDMEYSYYFDYYDIYADYEETINVLAKLGLYVEEKVELDKVTSVLVDVPVDESDAMYQEQTPQIEFTDPGQIEVLVDATDLKGIYGDWVKGKDYKDYYSVTILFVENEKVEAYNPSYGTIRKEDAPKFLKKAMTAYE